MRTSTAHTLSTTTRSTHFVNSENTHHTYHHTLTRAWSRLRSTLYSPLPQTCALVMTHVSAVKSRLKEHDPRVEGSLEALIAPSHPPMQRMG